MLRSDSRLLHCGFNTCTQYITSIGSVSGGPDPPTLSVSRIGAASAVVALQSKLESNAVRFEVKYRKDDDKEAEWTVLDVEENAERCTISGLVAETDYVVAGRLLELKTTMFSALAEATSFKTLTDATPSFEFDPAKKSDVISLSNGNKTATTRRQQDWNCWRSVLGKTKLSAETMSAVHWELTLMQHISGNLNMMIGYLDGDQYAAAKVDDCIGQSGHINRGAVLHVYKHERFFRNTYGGGATLDDIGHKARDCKAGDRFEIQFDFVAKQATAFYNGRCLGLIADALPANVYSALSLYYKGDSLETTKFNIFNK